MYVYFVSGPLILNILAQLNLEGNSQFHYCSKKWEYSCSTLKAVLVGHSSDEYQMKKASSILKECSRSFEQ